jgi:hypothetical protein
MAVTMDKTLCDDIESWLKTSDTLATRYFKLQDELLASPKVKWIYAKSFEVGNVPAHSFGTTAKTTKQGEAKTAKQGGKDGEQGSK